MPVPVPEAIPETFSELANRVSNWGRWGPDDRIGTLNLIDRAARQRGTSAVVEGTAYPLGLPLSEEEGIQMGFVPGRVNPTRTMVSVNEPLSPDPAWISSSEDVVTMALQCATHWDGLAHVSYGAGPDGLRLYNGYPATSVTDRGAAILGIQHVRTLVSRGSSSTWRVRRDVQVLEPGYPITPEDLDAACELAAVAVEPGDVVLVRTGQMVHLALPGRPGLGGAEPVRDLVAYTWPMPGLTMAHRGLVPRP